MKFNNEALDWVKSQVRRVNLGHIIVAICLVALSIWCFYNVEHITRKYYQRDTIISLENNAPVKTPFPGITICAPSIFKPQRLADLFPEFKAKLRIYEDWRRNAVVPNKEQEDYSLRNPLLDDFLKFEALALQKLSASEIIGEWSVQKEDLLEDCEFSPMNIRNMHLQNGEDEDLKPRVRKCTDIVPLLESIYEGKKCFTYFSDLHLEASMMGNGKVEMIKSTGKIVIVEGQNDKASKNDSEKILNYSQNVTQVDLPDCGTDHSSCIKNLKLSNVLYNSNTTMVFDLNPSIEVRVKAIENDVWGSYVRDPILMTVHPPNILQNRRDFLFFQVAKNNFYEISFSKKTTYLLPPPYKTWCIVYLEDPEYRVHITRDCCITNCIFNQVSSKLCANYYGVLTEAMFKDNANYLDQKICPHNQQNYSAYLEARNKCEKECPEECTKTIFEISGQVRNPYDDGCRKWWEVDDSRSDDEDGDLVDDEPDSNYDSIQSEDILNPPVFQDYPKMDIFNFVPKSNYLNLHNQWTDGHRIRKRSTHENDSSEYSSSIPVQRICQSARVSIKISPKPFITVRHQAAITYEGFMGTVGGHFGIWLGLSLYKVIKFTVLLLYNLLYKLLRCMISRWGPTLGLNT